MITGALFWSIWLGLQSQWPMQRLQGLLASRLNKVNRLSTKLEERGDVGEVLRVNPKSWRTQGRSGARSGSRSSRTSLIRILPGQLAAWRPKWTVARILWLMQSMRTLNKYLTGAKQINLVFIGHSIICTSKFSIKVHFFCSAHSTKNCFPSKLSVLEGWNQLWKYIMNS